MEVEPRVELGPNNGIVSDERQNPTHPQRRGRIRIPTAEEIATIIEEGRKVIDNVTLRSVLRMEGME